MGREQIRVVIRSSYSRSGINNKITELIYLEEHLQVYEYIAYKKSLGSKIEIESYELLRFVVYTRDLDYDEPLTNRSLS